MSADLFAGVTPRDVEQCPACGSYVCEGCCTESPAVTSDDLDDPRECRVDILDGAGLARTTSTAPPIVAEAPEAEPDADESWVEDGPTFAQRVAALPDPGWLVEGLLPDDGFALWHGDPRSLKSWLAIDTAIGLATGTLVAGYFPVPAPRPVLYVTNEDGERRVFDRINRFLLGRQEPWPVALKLAIRKSVWLDDDPWQTRLVQAVKDHGIRLVILDPLRSLTACVDAGPRELQPFALFARRLMTATGAALLGVHHDQKTQAGVKDTRRLPNKASGGGIFSIADHPCHFATTGEDHRATVTPSAWKFSEAPPPFTITVVAPIDDETARLDVDTTAPTAPEDEVDVALDERVAVFVAGNPGQSTNRVGLSLGVERKPAAASLKRLERAQRLVSRKQGHASNSPRFWYPAGFATPDTDIPSTRRPPR